MRTCVIGDEEMRLGSSLRRGTGKTMIHYRMSVGRKEYRNMRMILYLGKGGVGKTTISAATAARGAEMGKQTRAVENEPAHNPVEWLDRLLTAEPGTHARQPWEQ